MISISIDRDSAAYLSAIQKEGMGIWTNGLINDKLRETFFIPAVPMKYLMNREGIILARIRGGGSGNRVRLHQILNRYLGPLAKSRFE